MRLYKTLPEAIAILCSHAASSGSSAVDAHVDDYQWLKTDLQKPARDDYYLPLYELMREDHQPIIEPCLIHLGVTFSEPTYRAQSARKQLPFLPYTRIGRAKQSEENKKGAHIHSPPAQAHSPPHSHSHTRLPATHPIAKRCLRHLFLRRLPVTRCFYPLNLTK